MTTIELNNTNSLYGCVRSVQVFNYQKEMPRYFSDSDYSVEEIGNYILDASIHTVTVLSVACARDDLKWIIKNISNKDISLSSLMSAMESEHMRECGIRLSVNFELITGSTLNVITRNWNASTIHDI
jgi:hypothetical protein